MTGDWCRAQELAAVDERRAIVFVNTKRHCDVVSKQLEGNWNCCVLHGGKTQVPFYLLLLDDLFFFWA